MVSGSKEKHHVGEGAWVPLGTHPSASSHHGVRAQTLGQEVPKTGKCLTCVSELAVSALTLPYKIPMDGYRPIKTTHAMPFLGNQ